MDCRTTERSASDDPVEQTDIEVGTVNGYRKDWIKMSGLAAPQGGAKVSQSAKTSLKQDDVNLQRR